MATKNKQAPVQWIDIQLDAAAKKKFTEWRETNLQEVDVWSQLLMKGYKTTFSWSEKDQCYVCWLIPQGDDHQNAGCILTARSDDPYKALVGAYYRSEILKAGNWWTSKKEQSGQAWDF